MAEDGCGFRKERRHDRDRYPRTVRGHQICAEGTACFSWRVNPRPPLKSDSIMVVVRGAPRQSLNLRVSPELKQQVEEYAQVKGVSINAAAILLLAEGIRAERRKR